MKIVIVGAGTVGSAICKRLVSEGHDITIIDTNINALNDISTHYDVVGINGTAAEIDTLTKAGADKADIVIAVSSNDEINVICCIEAKKIGAKHSIARVRNPELLDFAQIMRQDNYLSMVLNPEYSVAKEISRMLRFPSAAKIDTFCSGRVEVAQLEISETSPLCNKNLIEIKSQLNMKFVICGVLRDGVAYIPSGDFVIQAHDVISVSASEEDITQFFKESDIYKEPIKSILIVGGTKIAYYLEELLRKTKIKSTVIEKDKAICKTFAENFDCTVVCDNGTSQEVLMSEGIDKKDAFLALSGKDEENAIVSMYAKTLGVKKIITLISAISYVDFFKTVGLESVVSPKYSVTSSIVRYVKSLQNTEDADIESLHRIMDDKIEVIEFSINEEIEGITNVPLKELNMKKNVLSACLVHDDKIIIPDGNTVISVNDTILIVTTEEKINSIKDIVK